MSASFTNQTLAQIELFANNKNGKYEKKVYVLPKSLDEKVARLHLAKIGVKLTELRPDQASYIGVPKEGPFKAITTGTDIAAGPARPYRCGMRRRRFGAAVACSRRARAWRRLP